MSWRFDRLAVLAWTDGKSRTSLASFTLKMRIRPELKPHAKNVLFGSVSWLSVGALGWNDMRVGASFGALKSYSWRDVL